jgi:hypothetical protein
MWDDVIGVGLAMLGTGSETLFHPLEARTCRSMRSRLTQKAQETDSACRRYEVEISQTKISRCMRNRGGVVFVPFDLKERLRTHKISVEFAGMSPGKPLQGLAVSNKYIFGC